ncbi:MAG: CAP domain-containing protein [Meiothermus sp.]|nr:CAP domain-containing protein [Meiothermus sp.]
MRPLLLLVLLGLAACGTPPATPTGVQYTPAVQSSYVQAVNAVRTVAQTCNNQTNSRYPKGPSTLSAAGALSWSGLLGEVARQRANYLNANSVDLTGPNAHTEGSDPTPFATRARNNGYAYLNLAENLGNGFSDADAVVGAWLSSQAGHCNALMDTAYTQMGLASVGSYWVLIMGKPQ